MEAGRAAMKLTDDQKTKLADIRKEAAALAKEVREKVVSHPDAEQKEQLKERRGHRRERRSEA